MNDDELEDAPAPRRARPSSRPQRRGEAKPARSRTGKAAATATATRSSRASRSGRSDRSSERTPAPRRDPRRPQPRRDRDAPKTSTASTTSAAHRSDRTAPTRPTVAVGSAPTATVRRRGRTTGERAAVSNERRSAPRATRATTRTGTRTSAATGHRGRRGPGAYRKVSGVRLTIILLATLGAFAALLIKLAGLQAVSPDRYAERAKEQRLRVETLPATRGAIVDRNGDPLVTTETRKTIYTDPANIEPGKAPEIAATLAPILQTSQSDLQAALESDSNFRYLARKVDDGTAARVMALGYRGIYSLDEATRLKPAADLALSVIGRVDTENVGISGVERSFDAMLTGTPGELVQERSLGGDHTIPSGRQTVAPATPGSTVMLTIDRNLQQVAEQAVADQVEALQAKAGAAVVMDRSSGEIVAMASIVTDSKTGKAINDDQNRAITLTYDPGSVMKIVTMSGAIETGLVAASTVRKVPPSVDFFESTFVDDSRWEDEDMSVTEILARSSNVGTIMLAKDLGAERLSEGIGSFGFGMSTGIGLDLEDSGLVPALREWSGTSLPTLAIGQGLTATPLQVLAAYNTIANNGEYVSPTVVKSIVSPDTKDATRVVANRHRVVSQDTAEQVRSMLAAVVSTGTGTRAQVPGYNVAGKTGTAWKARAGGGYGSEGDRDYLATFVGFAPVEDPKFSIIVIIDEPRSGNYTGGGAAAPVFATIARQALLSYDVPPDAPGWTQPADGTNLRAHPAEEPPPPPDPAIRLGAGAPGNGAAPGDGAAPGHSAAPGNAAPSTSTPAAATGTPPTTASAGADGPTGTATVGAATTASSVGANSPPGGAASPPGQT